jgi:replication factor C subunit 3/5
MLDKKNKKFKLLPWSEKYRPHTMKNIIFHTKIINAITTYIANNRLPHLLFYGPPGTGKTSTIVAFAKEYYRESYDDMVLILNASEERGIETVRNRIKQFVITKGTPCDDNVPIFKLIILDEIDAMTEDAQAILRKIIEKYVSNVRFCFICNYLKKINPAIQSRCIVFRFNPISTEIMIESILKICKLEKINLTTEATNLIIKRCNGDMRKLLNILQSLHMYNYKFNDDIINVDDKCVSLLLSCPCNDDLNNILNFIQNNDLKSSYKYLIDIIDNKKILLSELIDFIYEILMDSVINNNKTIIKYTDDKIINIIKNMSIINENLCYCNNDNIQIYSFVGIFYI